MNLLDRVLHRGRHTCPWWLCFTFDNPLRRRMQKPDQVLNGLLQPSQTALDIGCGMGYFSLEMARVVGPGGRVYCIDLQDQMLETARRRADKAGLKNISFHRCSEDSLGLDVSADLALTFWMVHEVRDQAKHFREVSGMLKPGGTLLMAEPRMHVPLESFESSVKVALSAGFETAGQPAVAWSRAMLLKNSSTGA
jgi:ubiquinone/menaquinone biosynthesis C-methylase UbiE